MSLPATSDRDTDPVLDAFLDAWHAPTAAALAACCVDDLHYEDPLLRRPLEGTARLADHIGSLRRAVPDLRVTRTGPRLGDAGHAALPVAARGTQTGPLGSLPASGRPVETTGIWWCELRDGRLARVRAVFDTYALAVQIGVLPRGGTAGSRALLMLRGFGLRG